MTKAYRPLVTKVDRDGNEIAGIRLPDIAVPVATYTGWNLYRAPYTDGELCDRDGSFLTFARTKSERAAKGDPRLSLEERYAGQADYAQQVLAAVTELVRQRLLLREDAETYVLSAAKRGLFQ
jgi:hypothetical protein